MLDPDPTPSSRNSRASRSCRPSDTQPSASRSTLTPTRSRPCGKRQP